MSGFDYSKWDKIELSDDEEDNHPNICKDSWWRLKHRTRVEREEDDGKTRVSLEKQLKKKKDDLSAFGESGQTHLKAQNLRKEINEIEAKLAKMDKEMKLNADNMCKTVESRTEVMSSTGPEPKPEPKLKGEAIAQGYCEFVEEHEELLEKYISLGEAELDEVMEFLKQHGSTLLVGEHAESYLLLDCLEKEMNGDHAGMVQSARQNQILTQLREFSRAAQRPVRDTVHPVFQRLMDHDETRDAFDSAVNQFIKRIEVRAVQKKKEMDEEEADNPLGPGGLDPIEVLRTLPGEMQEAFRCKDLQRLEAAVDSLPEEEAKYHLRRCEESGLWVPNPAAGQQPYQQ